MTAPAGTATATPATVAAATSGEPTGEPTGGEPNDSQTAVKLNQEQQAFVDQLVAKRLKESKERLDGEVEKRVAEQLKREKMDAAERAAAERDEARKQADEAVTGSKRAVAEARVETALLAAKIKPERVEAIARLVDLDTVMSAEDVRKGAAEAVAKALNDYPEFRPTPGASGGELGGGGGGAGAVTLEQFKGMDYDARVELFEKNRALYDQLTAQIQGA